MIPVVDFSGFGDGVDLKSKLSVSQEICKAFADIGFVYLKGHGISQDTIQKALKASKGFFDLPKDVKLKYDRDVDNLGYTALGDETLNPDKNQIEIRESILIVPGIKFPTEVPGFQEATVALHQEGKMLSKRILQAMAYGLQLKINFFTKCHTSKPGVRNRSCLRLLHYPEIDSSMEGQILNVTRCGEHTDYGTLTILFQEENGQGLEVRNRKGDFVNAPPIPGTVLVNIGEVMQRWTSDKLIATRHRVHIVPGVKNERRYSMAFFCNPDDDVILKCIDGEDKYPTIKYRDYNKLRFQETYLHKPLTEMQRRDLAIGT